MRNYPRNSPLAAGRVLALMLIADGNVCASEIRVLKQLDAEGRLGLPPGGLDVVLRDLCEDLMMGGQCTGSVLASLDAQALRSLMDEVSNPHLRDEVMSLAHAAASADQHFADAEAFVLGAVYRYWSIAPSRQRLTAGVI